MDNRKRAQKIIKRLTDRHPDAGIAINFRSPLELLVATILSAQSTDKTVNEVTKNLFKKYQKAEDYGNANLHELENDIRSTGFYHSKAKYLKKTGQILSSKFDSKIPTSMNELITLPGVGRKTANIVLSNAFGVVEGVAVDTHVQRLAQRLELSNNKTPDKIESDLMKLLPKEQWSRFTDLLIFHGRRVCTARKPNCRECTINRLCPSASTFG
ncbi:MAG: endonuclease III [Candidatus Bathyarchaeota archaeon]|nr:MAG: endonuclease III [Candidatus Bathyarchaeota archaeon]